MSPRHPASKNSPASSSKNPRFPFGDIPEQIYSIVPYIDNPKYDPANGLFKLKAAWTSEPAHGRVKAHKSMQADLPQGAATLRVMEDHRGRYKVWVTTPDYKYGQRKQILAREFPTRAKPCCSPSTGFRVRATTPPTPALALALDGRADPVSLSGARTAALREMSVSQETPQRRTPCLDTLRVKNDPPTRATPSLRRQVQLLPAWRVWTGERA